jgi:hypothetical protein
LEVTSHLVSNHWNHTKIFCEAIPAVFGLLGGFDGALNKVADKFTMNQLYGPGISTNALWPARDNLKQSKRKRWLHGDYKDAAFIYVRGLYKELHAPTTSIGGANLVEL